MVNVKGDFLITDNVILWDTEYGRIKCNLKKVMKRKGINIYQLSRIADIKYDVIKRYATNQIIKYDSNVLSKLCYCLDCNLSDLLKYEKSVK